ncbi:hypothetical protein [Corynebacterium sp. A21]|uniref:hypothetical protein n=1 Tax=Corynebacterium sp. A21 TaxID=3457318 RepID=UPI003FD2F3B7
MLSLALSSLSSLSSSLGGALSPLLALMLSALTVLSPGIAPGSSTPEEPLAQDIDHRYYISDVPVGDQAYGGRLTPWREHRVVDQHTLQIFFDGGDPSCSTYRLEALESDSEIIVSLYSGSRTTEDEPSTSPHPGTGGLPILCPAVLRFYRVEIKTESPIGDREIIDLYDLNQAE